MGFKRKLCWLILVLMPLFLPAGCGDLKPDMQDTRTVILKMNFNKRSSSRNSQISQAEVSSHKTHLILALPSWENLSSNYKNYYSSFAQELMNPTDNKVSLEISLNTQMKIFAFLFSEDYTMPQLFSVVREVGYYGESQPFSIGTNTNSLSLGITLIQVQGTGIDTGTTAPVIETVTSVTSPTSDSTPNYTFASTVVGTITYGGSCSSGITSAVSGNNTITFIALSDGTYSDCTIKVTDSDGNVSNILTIPSFTVAKTAPSATTIAAGAEHTCNVLNDGTVKCWGRGGTLGIDNYTTMGDDPGEMAQLTGINLGTGRTAKSITAGAYHTCVVLDDNSAKCWGENYYGQLGIDNSTKMGDNSGEMAQLTGINLGTGRTATAISAKRYHTCALLDNGVVKCWGYNNSGQLGIDNTTNMGDNSGEMAQLTGINLGTGRTAIAIAAGDHQSCAVLDDGSVKCWGLNNYGQLGIDNKTYMGNGPGEMAALPTINLGTGRTAKSISAGLFHTCAVLDDGSVKCWGYNLRGQLGIDNTTTMGDNSGEMAQLSGIILGTGRTATSISAKSYNTCAVLDDGSVKCWGRNNYGELGIDNTTVMGDNPGEMAQLTGINLGTGRTATAIAIGQTHSCAKLDNGAVKCWGRNNMGQLGIDNTTDMGDDPGEMASLPSINL